MRRSIIFVKMIRRVVILRNHSVIKCSQKSWDLCHYVNIEHYTLLRDTEKNVLNIKVS